MDPRPATHHTSRRVSVYMGRLKQPMQIRDDGGHTVFAYRVPDRLQLMPARSLGHTRVETGNRVVDRKPGTPPAGPAPVPARTVGSRFPGNRVQPAPADVVIFPGVGNPSHHDGAPSARKDAPGHLSATIIDGPPATNSSQPTTCR